MQAAFALDWSFIVAEGVGVFVLGVLGLNMLLGACSVVASCGSIDYLCERGCVF
jgi:hypothetical protein